MNSTSILFKLKDRLEGGGINLHYNDIKNHFESINPSYETALNNLLAHTIENVPYYKDSDINNLDNFSIVNKTLIKSHFQEFRATNYDEKGIIKMITSGSTGTPFTVYQDKNKKARNYGDTLYFGNLGGYHLGNKLIYLKIWVKKKMQASWRYKLQNIVPVDVINLNDKEIKKLIFFFNNNSNQTLNVLGYVSALEQIIRYCEKNKILGFQCKFSGIITMSEGLSSETRQKLQELFECHVVSRYSNIENGIIAQQEIDTDYFLVNTASYLVEIFHPEKDNLLPDDNLGRIVITDLYNYAMPMIRYDTGDFGSKIERNGKTYLKTVEGRKLDLLFDTSGNIVSSYIMYKNMWQYEEIEQYQLIQIGKKSYEFKVNCPQGFKRESQLVQEFKTFLGADADFRVTYVEGIPLLSSGKYRKTVNLYRKS
ncbi:CoF synthetase [Aequorivita marina]|uniref:CoF synthetase n=1 Tax=Aequorivita marina TaxID=3073654 RepID=UPI002876EFD1|nr:CoF synthetase [Aequorivita sp. S2608]MDS1299049.1 CoF synthetase [Aequorivita sp. S2608]